MGTGTYDDVANEEKGFLAVFGGIAIVVLQPFAITCASIPKGLDHSAQGWPIPRGLPWVALGKFHNPERFAPQPLTKGDATLSGLC